MALPFDKYFLMNRSHQRQSLALQWPQCHPDPAVGVYQPPLWPYPPPESTMGGFSTPSSPLVQAYEEDHARSVSRSPEYQAKPWNDVIYAEVLSSSTSPSLPSRPASAATGAPAPRPPTSAHSRSSSSRPSPERQRPKLEAVEDVQIGCFVMEPMGSVGRTAFPASTLLPMEVPLRATQASGEMRKMMNVFRLNPFALQNGDAKRSGSVCSSDSSSSADSDEPSPKQFEAQPLEEEPLIFEFQVQLEDPEGLVPETERGQDAGEVSEKTHAGAIVESPLCSPPLPLLDANTEEVLHSFPPDFELHKEAYDYQTQERIQSTWDDSSYAAPASSSTSHWNREADSQRDYHSSLFQNIRTVPSQSYLRKSARTGYEYPYDPQLAMSGPLQHPSHQEDYSSMRFSQNADPISPPRSRTESPFAEEMGYHGTPARHLSIDNSEIYSQNQSATFYGHAGSVTEDPSATSSHRRWSLPVEASGAMMMTSHNTMAHVHPRMAVPSHSSHSTNQAFFVPHMR